MTLGLGYGGTPATLVTTAEVDYSLPTGALTQTMDRRFALTNLAALTSAQLFLTSIGLRAGKTYTSVSWLSATTAAGTPLNQWFCLYDSARAKLAVTSDDTTTAWAANSYKTLTLSSTYTATTTGLYYVGICVVATTVPTLRGMAPQSQAVGNAPILCGTSTGSLTDPASAPTTAAAITATGISPYVYMS